MFALLLITLILDENPNSIAVKLSATSDVESAAESVKQFESSVRPLLLEHCTKCHGAGKQWAGLRLDSREAILKGGDSGPAAVPGEAESSLLIRAVRHDDENLQMPQDEKLTDAQIQLLTDWVNSGMTFPAAGPANNRTRDPNHWSFQPPAKVEVPQLVKVEFADRAHNEIDHFVLAKMESAGVTPSPQADRETLIRRLTFDLTGLPPTPEEISAFLNDKSDDAYSKLIDRLLESPAYGERWGRHWLDVARYADSNGLDENVAHGNAWRYRDYVVQSFNADKPFNQFITEQIAGDLLKSTSDTEREQRLIATGFLSIGPKVLAEVNMPKMRMDIVDEQIDTVGRVFLGMTFGCARCHDHKFDPISAADYYGLAGIFKSTKTMDTYTKVARWHEHPLKNAEAATMQAEYDAQLAAKKQAIETLVAAADAAVKASLKSDPAAADSPAPESLEPQYPDDSKAALTKLREELAALEKAVPELPAAMGVVEDEITDVPIHVRGNPSKLGDVVARHLPPVMLGPEMPTFASDKSGRRELAGWLTDARHPLTARVLVNRVWRWHFGRGLVKSTDNFGLLGEKPTHPELLDWLAQRFIEDQWSLKKLHRTILHSSVYQQSSLATAENLEKDPDNSLWTYFPVRRLSAEEIRDAMLFVSGQLDQSPGGSLLKVKNRGYLFDHTSIDTTDYNSRRRSLYLPVIRNNVYELFQLLDFPDPAVPTGDRATTTVAPQALMMMNSGFVIQAADDLSKRILSSSGDDSVRIEKLYALVLGRSPSPDEVTESLAFLQETKLALAASEANKQEASAPVADSSDPVNPSWSVLCQILLASSEFIYVR